MSILDHSIQIDNTEYHCGPRLSWSKFKRFLESPIAFRHAMDNPKPSTTAMAFGSLCHCLEFEPELFARDYHVFEKLNWSTKAGKEQKADLADEERELVSVIDYQRAENVVAAFRGVFNSVASQGYYQNEAAFYATGGGVDLQCKCDRIFDEGQVYDLKTCADLRQWVNSMQSGDWILGDAWYRMVIEAATGTLPPPIIYIGVQTSEPFDAIAVHYPADMYEVCKLYLTRKLAEYQECVRSGVWPGIGGIIRAAQCVDLKPWAMTAIQSEVLESPEYEDYIRENCEVGL